MVSDNADGVVSACDDHWLISGKPHVLFRAERAILNARRNPTGVQVPLTGEGSRDVFWFAQRYRLIIQDPVRLRRETANFMLAHGKAEKILAGKFNPEVAGFKPGKKPRAYQVQAAKLWHAMKGLLVADDLGLGKAQPLDCKVLTPSGWIEIGGLKVGDDVIDPDGGVGQVTGVFDRGVREVFAVTTNDGRSTRCCDEHLWNVTKPNDRRRGTCRVVPLAEIRNELTRTYSGQEQSQWFLPVSKPTPGRSGRGELPISPYLLGYLIGDGCMKEKSISVSCYTAEIRELIKKALPESVTMRQVKSGCHDYRLTSSVRQSNEVLSAVRALGLGNKRSWEKSIPEEVFGLQPEERLEFLRGLMDADGTISKDGTGVTFTSTSEKLTDGARELIESLGGFASKTTRITSFTYNGERK